MGCCIVRGFFGVDYLPSIHTTPFFRANLKRIRESHENQLSDGCGDCARVINPISPGATYVALLMAPKNERGSTWTF